MSHRSQFPRLVAHLPFWLALLFCLLSSAKVFALAQDAQQQLCQPAVFEPAADAVDSPGDDNPACPPTHLPELSAQPAAGTAYRGNAACPGRAACRDNAARAPPFSSLAN